MSSEGQRDRFNPLLAVAVVLCVVLVYAAGVATLVLDHFSEPDRRVEESRSALTPPDRRIDEKSPETSENYPEPSVEQPGPVETATHSARGGRTLFQPVQPIVAETSTSLVPSEAN